MVRWEMGELLEQFRLALEGAIVRALYRQWRAGIRCWHERYLPAEQCGRCTCDRLWSRGFRAGLSVALGVEDCRELHEVR